jgi:uncharacterized oxidoreductase
MINLKNKTILLTGASSGIGLELSKKLDKEGAKLILVGRKFKNKELEGDHAYIEADFTKMEDIKILREEIGKQIFRRPQS